MENKSEATFNGIIDIYEECEVNQSIENHLSTVSEIQTELSPSFGRKHDLNYCGTSLEICNDKKGDLNILGQLKKAYSKSSKRKSIPSLDFPQLDEEPINEYDGIPLFTSAFPWLFPGGVGDIYDTDNGETKNVHLWLEALMRHKDGRFQHDSTFYFYANDYCQRKLANSNGGFFIRNVCGQLPPSLDELKKLLEEGDFSFINK